MPFYIGSSKDGSDMQEFEGVYVSEDGMTWSNQPFSQASKNQLRKVHRHQYRKIESKDSNIKITWVCDCGKSLNS